MIPWVIGASEKRASGDYGWKTLRKQPRRRHHGGLCIEPIPVDFQILQPGDANASSDLVDTEQEMHFSWLLEDKSSIGTNGCSGYVTSEESRIAGGGLTV